MHFLMKTLIWYHSRKNLLITALINIDIPKKNQRQKGLRLYRTPPRIDPITVGIAKTAPIPGPPPMPPRVFTRSIPWPKADIIIPRFSLGVALAIYAGAPDIKKLFDSVIIRKMMITSQKESTKGNSIIGMETRNRARVKTLSGPNLSVRNPVDASKKTFNTEADRRVSPHCTSDSPMPSTKQMTQ